jgi:hypothetical protein
VTGRRRSRVSASASASASASSVTGAFRRLAGRAALLAVLAVLTGCGGYRVQVVAIESSVADARFVDADRVPADALPVGDARVTMYRDPGSLRESAAGDVRTSSDGRGTLRIDGFGAGWMDEQWRIEVTAPGHEAVSVIRRLPGSGERLILLVELRSGASSLPRRDDPIEEYRRFR